MGSQKHTDARREYQRAYWAKPVNKARRAKSFRLYREKNKDALRERRLNNQDEKERSRVRHKEKREKIRNEIFDILGHACVKCGFADERALQIDHINGGGSKTRRAEGGNRYYSNILTKIQASSNEYQILCANCNWIKRLENKEL